MGNTVNKLKSIIAETKSGKLSNGYLDCSVLPEIFGKSCNDFTCNECVLFIVENLLDAILETSQEGTNNLQAQVKSGELPDDYNWGSYNLKPSDDSEPSDSNCYTYPDSLKPEELLMPDSVDYEEVRNPNIDGDPIRIAETCIKKPMKVAGLSDDKEVDVVVIVRSENSPKNFDIGVAVRDVINSILERNEPICLQLFCSSLFQAFVDTGFRKDKLYVSTRAYDGDDSFIFSCHTKE